jgi:hypothetical protein
MTDDELLARLAEVPVDEWSDGEIELLRARARENPAVRAAFDEHLLLETVLTARLTRVRISAEAVLARVDAERRTRLAGRTALLAALALVVVGLAGAVWYVAAQRRPADPVAKVEPQKSPLWTEGPLGPQNPPAAASGTAAPPALPVAAPSATAAVVAPPATPVVTPTTDTPEPWVAMLARAPRALEELAYDDRRLTTGAAALARWWDLMSGQQTPQSARDEGGLEMRGAFKLRSPWPADGVLTVWLRDESSHSPFQKLFHFSFWHGDDGVIVEFRRKPYERWTAYRAKKKLNDAAKPGDATKLKEPGAERLWFASDDEDRGRRTSQAPVDISFHDGRLYLSRGDIVLLSAPLPGPPEATYFEGHVVVKGLGVARSTGFPMEWLAPPLKTWSDYTAETALRTSLPDGATVERHGPASFTLASNHAKQSAWAALPISRPGFHEAIFEIESADALTGVYLGDAEGKPHLAVCMLDETLSGARMIDFIDPASNKFKMRHTPFEASAPRVGFPLWLRLIAGCNSMKCYASLDGVAWGRILDPKREGIKRSKTVGLICLPGSANRSIRVRNVSFHTLLTYDDALAGELPPFPKTYDFVPWFLDLLHGGETEQVRFHRLAKGLSAEYGWEADRNLLHELAAIPCGDTPPGVAKTVERDLDYIDRLGQLVDAWDQGYANLWADRLARSPTIIAEQRTTEDRGAEEHDLAVHAPYSSIRRALLENIPATAGDVVTMPSEPIRREIARLMLDGDWDRLDRACRVWHRYGGRPDPPGHVRHWAPWMTSRPAIMPLIDWAAAQAERRRTVEEGTAAGPLLNPFRAEWKHPLVEQFGKEGYNVLAELETALTEKAYADACRIITSVTAAQAIGLLPNAHDADLLTSLPGAVALAMKLHPELRSTMQNEYGDLAMLRLKEASADGDVDAVRALTTQFYGTSAAAQAQLWLGDRSLSQGDAARAEAHYHAAAREGSADDADAIAARLRLAAAWQGRDVGTAPQTSLRFGETTLSPAEFERVVSTLRGRAAAPTARAHSATAVYPPTHIAQLPPATSYKLKPWAVLDGDVGKNPDPPRKEFDYVAAQTAVAFANGRMLVSNRFQTAAYDLKDGKRVWRTSLGNEQGRTHQWPGVAMTPVVVDDLLYVRRLPTAGPELACLDVRDGRVVWRSPRGEIVASDPLVTGDRVTAVTLTIPQTDVVELALTMFDAATGRVLRRRAIGQLRDHWKRELNCYLVAAEEMLVVSAAGCILGCDGEGEPRWARRLLWMPAGIDAYLGPVTWTPPTVSENRVEVVQPGVPFRSVVDARTGSLIEQHLELREERRGAEPWELQPEVAQAADGTLVGPVSEVFARKLWRSRLAWRQNDVNYAHVWLGPWSKQPRGAGPVVEHQGRLWAFTAEDLKKSTRQIEELVPSDERPAAPAILAAPSTAAAWRRSTLGSGHWEMARLRPEWTLMQARYVAYTERLFLENRTFLEDDCVVTQPTGDRPVFWSRDVALPADRPTSLHLRTAPAGEAPVKIEVRVGDETLFEKTYELSKGKTVWHDERIDLKPFQGRRVRIVVIGKNAQEKPTKTALVAWQKMELE